MKLPSLIGVIHLPPLAGSPRAGGEGPAALLQEAGLAAVQEARVFEQSGFEGVILENFGDAPFFKDRAPSETIASMAVIAAAVREACDIPIGINVLRNDGFSALSIASVTGCDWIRVNALSGVVASDQGLLEGHAAQLLRERARLSSDVLIFADVWVKHARNLSSDSLELALEETAVRALADAAIVTGPTTGRLMDLDLLKRARESSRRFGIPLFLGSGVTLENLQEVMGLADGYIVGSALRRRGVAGEAMDTKRVRDFAKRFFNLKSTRRSKKSRK